MACYFLIFRIIFQFVLKLIGQVNRKNDRIIVREENEYNVNQFKEKVTAVNWSEVEGFNGLNQSYQTFHSKFTQIHNTNFANTQIKQKNFRNKPWLSKGILKSIKKISSVSGFYEPCTLETESCCKRYKNKLNHLIRIAISTYYVRKLENVKSNIKSTWRVLNEVTNKKRTKARPPSSFRASDNIEISDITEI